MDEPKNKAEETAAQESSTEEPNSDAPKVEDTTQKNKDDQKEEVVLTQEEYEKLQKKATDFDGIMEKNRLAKLSKKNKPEVPDTSNGDDEGGNTNVLTAEDVQKIATEIADQKIQQFNQGVYEENLSKAIKQFTGEHPWSDNEEVFSKISENFTPGALNSVEALTERLKLAAQNTYPTEYNKSIEESIKAKVFKEKESINAGDIVGGGSARGEEQAKSSDTGEKKFFKKQEPIENWFKKPEAK